MGGGLFVLMVVKAFVAWSLFSLIIKLCTIVQMCSSFKSLYLFFYYSVAKMIFRQQILYIAKIGVNQQKFSLSYIFIYFNCCTHTQLIHSTAISFQLHTDTRYLQIRPWCFASGEDVREKVRGIDIQRLIRYRWLSVSVIKINEMLC